MSKVQEFLKKLAEDKALQEKMTAIMGSKPEEISDKVVVLAKENGFEITFGEFLDEVKPQEGEVSDDELDKVAGGSGYWEYLNNPEAVERMLALDREIRKLDETLKSEKERIQKIENPDERRCALEEFEQYRQSQLLIIQGKMDSF